MQVEYKKEMLDALNKVNWRRLDVEFQIPKSKALLVHEMTAGKTLLSDKENLEEDENFLLFFAKILAKDAGIL